MRRISVLVGVLVILLLIVPGAALASSTCQAYNPQLCSSVGSTSVTTGSGGSGSSPTSASAESSSAATLPFTGLDVVLLVAGGGTLLGAGFVGRRLSRKLS